MDTKIPDTQKGSKYQRREFKIFCVSRFFKEQFFDSFTSSGIPEDEITKDSDFNILKSEKKLIFRIFSLNSKLH